MQGATAASFYRILDRVKALESSNATLRLCAPPSMCAHRAHCDEHATANLTLGMSDFDARGLIRQKIVSTFRILIKHRSQNDLHTCGTQKAHHAKMRFLCLLCAHHNVPDVRAYL